MSAMTYEQALPLIEQGYHFHATEAGLVRFTEAEEAEWAAWQAAQAPTLADRKAAKNAAVTAYRDTILNNGYTVQSGEMTGHVLQTRMTGEDRTNWLISQNSYKAAIDAGQGAVVGARFRTKDNVNFTVSFSEGYSVILAMAAWGAQVIARSWALKDAVDAALDDAELDAIDITTGWPA